nr:hypothetical protein [Smithellaceae bacterium]
SAGTLTGGVINVAYSGNASGHIEMTGGTMSVSGLYLGGGSTETASMNLLGGSFYSDSYVQIGTASAQGHMVISSKADVGLGGIWIGRSGKLTLVLDGGDGDFTRAVVDVTAGNNDNRYWASTGAQGEIDLSKYTATAEQTITLIHTAGIVQGSVDISWVISCLDEGKYSVGEGAYWNGSDLMLTISLVPEPAYAAGLLGFAALLLAARRRK